MTKRRITGNTYKHAVAYLCACVFVCLFVHSPFEITGKRKWRNAGEHLLIAKSLGEAFDNDASGRCSTSSISADGASINAACRLNFAPKLKEFLHVVSANNINFYFSIYFNKQKQNTAWKTDVNFTAQPSVTPTAHMSVCIKMYVFSQQMEISYSLDAWTHLDVFSYFLAHSFYKFMRLICVYATESWYFFMYVWTFDIIFNVTLVAAARINKHMYLHTLSHAHTHAQRRLFNCSCSFSLSIHDFVDFATSLNNNSHCFFARCLLRVH